ncbi:ArgE/DapE family deacylase [Phycicoccus sp. MQZ13P-5]|uniref:ArgE/DapE family deacylase n=1 Tax=Phycicoccus sonneratiae TaxID=2807628 RepID=A0ABS2CPL7_9MICO|nr:ArgE/DapE family deacylase [Phycicoccus sonneraticus]
MSEDEGRVLEALDERRLVEDLVALVRVPSVTGSAAEGEVQHLLAGWFDEVGLEVDMWSEDLDALRADPGFPGSEAPRTEAWGLVGTTPGDGEPALVLQGHVDVVPVGDPAAWAHDPFAAVVHDGRLHGRGACDMKAGVAVNLAVARALHRSGVRSGRRLALHSVVGEEDGGLGAFATLRRGHTGEVAVVTEPTSGRLLTANAGALTFRLEVTGLAAHGSTRLEGVSALDTFAVVHAALRRLEAARNASPDPLFAGTRLPYALSVGQVRAGDWASSVPDLLVAEGRYGVALDEDPQAAREAFVRCVAEAASGDPWLREHPPVVTWPGGAFAPGRLPAGHPLADEVADAAEAVGMARPTVAAAPYGSDLRLYAAAGVPTLQYGPGDVRLAHSPRESVPLDEVVAVARALAVLAVRRLSTTD